MHLNKMQTKCKPKWHPLCVPVFYSHAYLWEWDLTKGACPPSKMAVDHDGEGMAALTRPSLIKQARVGAVSAALSD